MGRSGIIITVALLILILSVTGIYLYISQFIPKYDWYPTLREYEEEPYDLSVLFKMTENNPNAEFELVDEESKAILDTNEYGATYLFIGNNRFNLDSTELALLKSFARNGNDVVFITEGFDEYTFQDLMNYPKDSNNYFYYSYWYDEVIDSIIEPEIVNSNHKFQFHYKSINDTVPYRWPVLSADSLAQIDTSKRVKTLGYLKPDSINFIEIPYGEGSFFMHSNPVLFTNYMLLKENGLNYTNAVFRNFNQKKFYWDTYNKTAKYSGGGSGFNIQRSPLNFILSHKEFAWAWYLSLILVLIYIFIQSKRKQRIIPVLERKKNTSVEYAKALGSLFFNKDSHLGIATEMMRQFWIDVRLEHQLQKAKLESDPKAIDLLAEKSETRSSVIKGLLDFDKKIAHANAFDNHDLNHLYNLLQHYYSKTEKS